MALDDTSIAGQAGRESILGQKETTVAVIRQPVPSGSWVQLSWFFFIRFLLLLLLLLVTNKQTTNPFSSRSINGFE